MKPGSLASEAPDAHLSGPGRMWDSTGSLSVLGSGLPQPGQQRICRGESWLPCGCVAGGHGRSRGGWFQRRKEWAEWAQTPKEWVCGSCWLAPPESRVPWLHACTLYGLRLLLPPLPPLHSVSMPRRWIPDSSFRMGCLSPPSEPQPGRGPYQSA